MNSRQSRYESGREKFAELKHSRLYGNWPWIRGSASRVGENGAMTDDTSPKNPRETFPWIIATLIAMHACMAVTRMAASLWVLTQGLGEWTVGALLRNAYEITSRFCVPISRLKRPSL